MPGSSRRSKGCYRCRAKKVKCDEGVPECLRCVANGIKCPGYRPDNELTFCSMNQVVESKVFGVPSKKTRVRKSASPRQKSISVTRNQNASSPGDAQVIKDQVIIYTSPKETTLQAITRKMSNKLFTLSKPMATDWKDSALCLYFTDYVLESPDTNTSPGFLHGLPKLILANPDGLLAHAVAAVSLASFSNQVRSESLTVKSRQSYGKALIRISGALSDKSQASSEETLGGILLLNMFEMFSGDHITVWKTHADGLAHILRLRGTVEQFCSERGSGMARGAHRVVMFKNLLHRRTPGVETALFDQHLQGQTASWAQAGLACNRIARILPVADKVFAEDPLGDESSKHLLRVIALSTSEDKRFVQWQNSEAVKAVKSSITGVSDHEQLEIAGWWNPYRAARIILLETLSRLLDRVHMHPDLSHMVPEMNRLRIKVDQDMHTMVYEICATVSDVLGTMKEGQCVSRDTLKGSAIAGYTSVWPLGTSLKMVKTLSVEQRSFILAQLSYINAALGIKQAQIIKKVG